MKNKYVFLILFILLCLVSNASQGFAISIKGNPNTYTQGRIAGYIAGLKEGYATSKNADKSNDKQLAFLPKPKSSPSAPSLTGASWEIPEYERGYKDGWEEGYKEGHEKGQAEGNEGFILGLLLGIFGVIIAAVM